MFILFFCEKYVSNYLESSLSQQVSSMSNNQENQAPNNIIKKPNQPTVLANQEKTVADQFVYKFDPNVYQYPKNRGEEFQIVDNLVVYQNDTPVNHKFFGGMIIHDKPEINFFPTKAMIFKQRDGKNQERRFEIGKQTISVLANNKYRGNNNPLQPFKLKPDRELPRYAGLSRFDEDLSFVSNVTLGENVRFNCSRYENEGWVFDTVRMQELHALLQQEYSLDEKVEINDPKSFFRNLRITKANYEREQNSSSSSRASRHQLPESSSSISEDNFAQGNHWQGTPVYQHKDEFTGLQKSDYNQQYSLMNNGEFTAEFDKFKAEARERDLENKEVIKKLQFKVEQKENKYQKLKTSVKAIGSFVNGPKLMNEVESEINIHLNKRIVDSIDYTKPVPFKYSRVRIERIRDLYDHAMWCMSASDTSEDESPPVNSLSVNASSDENEFPKKLNSDERKRKFYKSEEKMVEKSTSVRKSITVPQGIKTSPTLFKDFFAENFKNFPDYNLYKPVEDAAEPRLQSDTESDMDDN